MLIKCPECELQVSDKALCCPHCGYPLKEKVKEKRSTKRRRLPNGFGRITKITGKYLRKPYRAMITVRIGDDGKPVAALLKPVAYFETYNEAYEALLAYHKNPYDIEKDITVKDLYSKWSESYFKALKPSSIRTIEASWKYCESIYDKPLKDIRVRHLKHLLETAEIKSEDGTFKQASHYVKERIKSVFNLMYDYAMEYEIVDHNYSRDFEISGEILVDAENQVNAHITFTDEEMAILWKNCGIVPYVDIILIQCYSGWRPQELGLILLEQTDLDNWVFRGGIKTKAGIDRIVPIHSKIKALVKSRYEQAVELGSKYLLNAPVEFSRSDPIRMTYDKYRHRFKKIIEVLALNPEHRAHDPRKQFITMAKKAKVDEYVIKKVVGHSVTDITEAVYTDRDIEWIRSEIEKIP